MKLSDQIKLRHLEIFVEIARHKSVGKAADALHLTQPAVSRAMRELEQACSRPLLERSGRGIRLSPHGQTFLSYAGSTLVAARDGLDAVRSLHDERADPVRVGALPTVSASIIPAAVDAFRNAGLPSRLKIVTGENAVLLDQLRNKELDIVAGRLPAPEQMLGLNFEPLYNDALALVVAKNHPLAEQKTITPEDFKAFPLLYPSISSIIRPYADRLFIEQGFPVPANPIETVSESFGRAFTLNYKAIWVIASGVIEPEVKNGTLHPLPIDTRSTLSSVGLCTVTDRTLSASARSFAELVRKSAAP